MNIIEIKRKCRKYGIINDSCVVTINKDGLIDVVGNVMIRGKFTKLPFKFNNVSGNFDCSFCPLTSLEGSPIEVGGSFQCIKCRLTSLEGCPKNVGGSFECSINKLTSLEYCPNQVNGNFYCSYNKLTSLERCPKLVGGEFDCSYNLLTSLEGCPENIKADFNCEHNGTVDYPYFEKSKITGFPKKIKGETIADFTSQEIKAYRRSVNISEILSNTGNE